MIFVVAVMTRDGWGCTRKHKLNIAQVTCKPSYHRLYFNLNLSFQVRFIVVFQMKVSDSTKLPYRCQKLCYITVVIRTWVIHFVRERSHVLCLMSQVQFVAYLITRSVTRIELAHQELPPPNFSAGYEVRKSISIPLTLVLIRVHKTGSDSLTHNKAASSVLMSLLGRFII